MMKWEMEILSPPNSVASTMRSWSSGSDTTTTTTKSSSRWSVAENKMFENALAIFDTDTPDRWHKVASMIPGKTVGDVIRQYKDLEADVTSIEAGLIPIPGYHHTSQFTLDWITTTHTNSHTYDGLKQSSSYGVLGKRSSARSPPEQERKKGVPWTEEEHKLFLMGLKKYGKGDWRNISRNFVVSRTPTQVASHAQKYFIRQLSGGKDKRRASIHDITTLNLNLNLNHTTTPSPSPENNNSDRAPPLPNPSSSSSTTLTPNTFNWNQQQHHNTAGTGTATPMLFNHPNGNIFISPPSFRPNSYARGLPLPDHQPQNIIFQMQATNCFPHG